MEALTSPWRLPESLERFKDDPDVCYNRAVTTALTVFAFLMGFFPPLSIACAYVSLGVFCLLALAACLTGRESFRPVRTFFDAPLLFFLGVWLATSLLGLDVTKSFGKFPSQLRFVFFYLLLWVGGGRYKSVAFKGYLWGAALACVYGILQVLASKAGLTAEAPLYLALKSGRAHGAVHPLTYAEVILPFFFLGTVFFVEADDRRDACLGAGWFLLSGTALLLSQGRGPWLAAVAGVGVLAFCHPRRIRFLGCLALIVAGILLFPTTRNRLGSMSPDVEDQSKSHRMILWHNAWEVVGQHWMKGVGPGNLRKAVLGNAGETDFIPDPWGHDGDAHNEYLQHLAERGVFGLAALLWLFTTPLVSFAKALHSSSTQGVPRRILWGLLAFYVAFFIFNLTERAFDSAEPAMVFWILAALLPVTGVAPAARPVE